ncbi:unnamed protein product, partial [Phaeothamnion confervicola]
ENVNLKEVANQTGTAIVKASNGAVVKATGDLEGPEGPRAVATLYRILLDTGAVLDKEPLKRITISFSSFQYVMAVSSGLVFIVKKTPT